MNQYLPVIVEFLNRVGLKTTVVERSAGFIDHCRITEGTIEVDPTCPPSGLLHEAGHLATVPAQYRHLFSGNVNHVQAAMLESVKGLGLHPDHPLWRAAIQFSEAEATAWAFAAGNHLSIPNELIVCDEDFQGDGAIERLRLELSRHYGIKGLYHAGFCKLRASSPRDLPVYPKLAFWLQPHIAPGDEVANV